MSTEKRNNIPDPTSENPSNPEYGLEEFHTDLSMAEIRNSEIYADDRRGSYPNKFTGKEIMDSMKRMYSRRLGAEIPEWIQEEDYGKLEELLDRAVNPDSHEDSYEMPLESEEATLELIPDVGCKADFSFKDQMYFWDD